MRTIGVVGLGSLGFPTAVGLGQFYPVLATDIRAELMTKDRRLTEAGVANHPNDDFETYVNRARLKFVGLPQIIEQADIVFVAVQTPHEPMFEGITPLPKDRKDFDYTYLERCVKDISELCHNLQRSPVIAIISTVLPGTMRRVVMPHVPTIVYNPFFIAMGTVIRDFYFPEFILLGSESKSNLNEVEDFYRELHGRHIRDEYSHIQGTLPPIFKISIEDAELAKICYNTFVSLKLAFANTVMELCHRSRRGDVDTVMDVLKSAGKRIVSSSYLKGGMGDGGACHPRDNIALSWLAREHNLSFDLFESIMLQREKQAEWLAQLVCNAKPGYPKVVLGTAFKKNSKIETGSHARLVINILLSWKQSVSWWDPYVSELSQKEIETFKHDLELTPHVVLVGAEHDLFKTFKFKEGSVIIDPFRFIKQQEGIHVISLGKSR